MGTSTNSKFEKKAATILQWLSQPNTFEAAQVELGELLGLSAGNEESDAAPDPWWLGDENGIVFEDHVDADPITVFGANKARQAAGHPKWVKKNLPGTQNMNIVSVLVTPCGSAKSGAEPHLDDVRLWRLDDFLAWASEAIAMLRQLKGTFPGEGDLFWRDQAYQYLEANGLTVEKILISLPVASKSMHVES